MADFPRWPFAEDDVLRDWSEGRMSIDRAAKYLHLQYSDLLSLAVRKGFSMPTSELYGVSEMDDFRLDYETTEGFAQGLTKMAMDVRYLGEHLSSYQEDADQTNPEAEVLWKAAVDEMRNAVRSLEAAAAWIEFALVQVAMRSPEATVLSFIPPEDTSAKITPTADFWSQGPVWEIYNSPLKGTKGSYWWLAIDDHHKAFGILKVVAFAYFGDDDDKCLAIPICDEQFKSGAHELTRTVALWIEIAREKAEHYIASFDPALPNESAAKFQKLRDDHVAKRKAEEWGEPVPE
ncbi:hypothetical protein B5E41_30145 [Rhizobium esperanzae]|uniref:Uncharacterized protein n=1 Tax=Rhizobium esperanzae TaxID=1967781 RepID=A0A246DKN6_9HYPH|nr:hypothetical protein [Rhizobium esperanzae]OWO89703.1 hypothetical protein B5E41_30145 [Rhizobium esperanzae]